MMVVCWVFLFVFSSFCVHFLLAGDLSALGTVLFLRPPFPLKRIWWSWQVTCKFLKRMDLNHFRTSLARNS